MYACYALFSTWRFSLHDKNTHVCHVGAMAGAVFIINQGRWYGMVFHFAFVAQYF